MGAIDYGPTVVSVCDVLQMTKVKPHQQMLQENLLVKNYDGLGMVVFVSHQWLAKAVPDP